MIFCQFFNDFLLKKAFYIIFIAFDSLELMLALRTIFALAEFFSFINVFSEAFEFLVTFFDNVFVITFLNFHSFPFILTINRNETYIGFSLGYRLLFNKELTAHLCAQHIVSVAVQVSRHGIPKSIHI
jgi:hypothetical protein